MNNLLFTLIVLINFYIITAPVLPQVAYWWDSHHTNKRAQLQHYIAVAAKPKATSQSTQGLHELIIPKMLLQVPTLDGPESNWFNLLYKGVWRWPGSSTPDKGGNTVFLAHRFSYTGPRGAFYYLNKLQIGDEVVVDWNGKIYTYSVTSTQTVSPTATEIEDNTSDSQITLFTCTPLWHPVDRLVVVAKLKSVS